MISVDLIVCPMPRAALVTHNHVDCKGGSGAPLQTKAAVWGEERGKSRWYTLVSVHRGHSTDFIGTGQSETGVWAGRWWKHVRGLGFHDKDLRLFLGGTAEICNQESDRDRFSWKNNP